MEAPLLVSNVPATEPDYLPVKSFKEAKLVFCTETVKLWNIAGPVALTSLFQYLTNTSTTIYADHLGDIELSSISLYNGVMASIYLGLLFGMSSSLGTLCGQAYGAGQIRYLGIYMQRSWIVLLFIYILLLPLYICHSNLKVLWPRRGHS
ncbi:hypothetical protein L6164_006014 [Bauhinia variegata]|uniref:Uncharacterized protein n=1 Tax=Bauhinia variegata TaxID=167791 RepID=A0ACB9PT35_BAUVA|nr:hypothetical protein L6164_006014 [Bauhinia variegata]